MKKLTLSLGLALSLLACKKDETTSGSFKGTDATVHGGKAWSSVQLKADGTPEQLVLSLDNNAIHTAPIFTPPGQEHLNHIAIELPAKAREVTPFQSILLDWDASSNQPPAIYDFPHFALRFYLVPAAEVAGFVDNAKLNKDPDPVYLPANHIGDVALPAVGKDWIDLFSPEVHGQPFTQTFMYGTYDGRLVFMKPMMTQEFLKNTASFERPLPQPARFQKTGYYPTTLKVIRRTGYTDIVLDGFVHRQQS